MTRLRERTVQIKALQELEAHYRKQGAKHVYARCEVRTKKANGGKRADGLICFRTEQNQYYTVSLEAKSHRTLGDLTAFVDDIKLDKHTFIAASIVALLAVTLMATYLSIAWYFMLVITVLTFSFTSLMTFCILDWLDLDRYKGSSVVEQLKQYPANEQWIAYSKYADNLLANLPLNRQKYQLKQLCKRNGFGLMLISNQKVEIEMKPKVKQGNFLSYYCKEDEIVSVLESKGTKKYRNPCIVSALD